MMNGIELITGPFSRKMPACKISNNMETEIKLHAFSAAFLEGANRLYNRKRLNTIHDNDLKSHPT